MAAETSLPGTPQPHNPSALGSPGISLPRRQMASHTTWESTADKLLPGGSHPPTPPPSLCSLPGLVRPGARPTCCARWGLSLGLGWGTCPSRSHSTCVLPHVTLGQSGGLIQRPSAVELIIGGCPLWQIPRGVLGLSTGSLQALSSLLGLVKGGANESWG